MNKFEEIKYPFEGEKMNTNNNLGRVNSQNESLNNGTNFSSLNFSLP